MEANLVRGSKWMSLVLRHKPEDYGLTLDPNGWVPLDDLLAAAQRADVPLTRALVEQIVAQNDKQRFALNAEHTAIRARQGHSVAVELGLAPVQPPDELFHGTATRFLPSIRQHGLLRQARQHVHLSARAEAARAVGQRHGKPVVIHVASGAMYQAGWHFFLSENGVWLVDAVPAQFLTFPAAD